MDVDKYKGLVHSVMETVLAKVLADVTLIDPSLAESFNLINFKLVIKGRFNTSTASPSWASYGFLIKWFKE